MSDEKKEPVLPKFKIEIKPGEVFTYTPPKASRYPSYEIINPSDKTIYVHIYYEEP